MKYTYLIISFILASFLDLQAQNIEFVGESIEINLNGYKSGQIQWQVSTDKQNWNDIKDATNAKLIYRIYQTSQFRAKVKNCDFEYVSDTTYIETKRLSDYQFTDSIGRYLSSDLLEGRAPGTHGDTLSANFIEDTFKKIGLAPLNGISYKRNFKTVNSNIPTFNIVGIIPGTDPLLKDEVIIISAHYDHLGKKVNGIYHGADDNATGIAGICLVARQFKEMKIEPKRTLLFLATGAEELSPWLQGMRAFVNSKEIAIGKIKYVFNFDMIGRLRDNQLFFYGKNYTAEIVTLINNQNNTDLKLTFSTNNLFNNSIADHIVFEEYKIPSFSLCTGANNRAHQLTDTWDVIDINGLIKIAQLDFKIINYFSGQ